MYFCHQYQSVSCFMASSLKAVKYNVQQFLWNCSIHHFKYIVRCIQTFTIHRIQERWKVFKLTTTYIKLPIKYPIKMTPISLVGKTSKMLTVVCSAFCNKHRAQSINFRWQNTLELLAVGTEEKRTSSILSDKNGQNVKKETQNGINVCSVIFFFVGRNYTV